MRVRHGGVLEEQTVTSSATHVNAIQAVTSYSGSTTDVIGGGTFDLVMDLRALGGRVCVTEPLDWDAPATTHGEVLGVTVGTRAANNLAQHGSVQSRLEALECLKDLGGVILK